MESIARRNRQLEAVLGAFPDISFVLDRSGRYLEVIGGVDESLYEDGRGLTGHRLHDVLPACVADDFLAVIHRALGSGRLQRVEYTLSANQVRTLAEERRAAPRAGVPQWFDARVLPMPAYEADEPAVLWVAFNITERKRLEEELRRLATTDDLTGVSNRRTALDHLVRLFRRAERESSGLSVLMLDIDRFKLINDGYGHAAGDRVIAWLAEQIRAVTRPGDLVARMGGDEFLIALPETDPAAAAEIAARINECVRSAEVPHGHARFRVTVSIGVASAPPAEEVEALLLRADTALYEAKAGGRDGFVVHAAAGGEPAAAAARANRRSE